MLFVAKEFQRQGIGTFAIHYAEQYVKEKNFDNKVGTIINLGHETTTISIIDNNIIIDNSIIEATIKTVEDI